MATSNSSRLVPTAKVDGLLAERVDDELVVFNTETKQAHCLKPLAAFVFERADGRLTEAELADQASRELGAGIGPEDIAGAVAQLREGSLLDEPLVVLNGHSRREALKRFAFAGAAATAVGPLITSIFAPSAAMAANVTVIPIGCPGCVDNHSCAGNCTGGSGHCCTNANQSCNLLLSCCVACNNSCKLANGGAACSVCLPPGQCPTTCPTGSPCPCITSTLC
jgi:hypothetical protein